MMVLLSKILPLLVLPIGITLALLIAAAVTKRRVLLVGAIALLWLSSVPVVGNRLLIAMEDGHVRIPAAAAPTADAIVVLSGGRPVAPGPAAISEWDDPDRFFGGVELLQAGKAPLLIFTGGWFPDAPGAPLEGDILSGYAKAMGVPADRVLTTGPVVNTLEESQAVAELVKDRQPAVSTILLVTSAFHVNRAKLLFERAGFRVLPYAVDFGVSRASRLSPLDFVPSAAALQRTQTAIREWYGRVVYQLIAP